jgi:4-oxalocrotonate tautomerase family enzyme
MPVIQCDIRRGRSQKQKLALGQGLTKAVAEITGARAETILVVIREHAGADFVEGGELLPDYQPGPNGEDLAGEAALKRGAATRG